MDGEPKTGAKKWEADRKEWTKEPLYPSQYGGALSGVEKGALTNLLKYNVRFNYPPGTKLSDVVNGLQGVWEEVRGYHAMYTLVAISVTNTRSVTFAQQDEEREKTFQLQNLERRLRAGLRVLVNGCDD